MTTLTATIYDQLFEQSQAIVEAYRTDFDHDKQIIGLNPTTQFIHIAYSTGTYLDLLSPFEAYPAPGVFVPYLFGQADRWHLLKSSGCGVRAVASMPRNCIIHYFDGKNLKQIDIKTAKLIVNDYQTAMTERFRDSY
jgi:hypothetical protein